MSYSTKQLLQHHIHKTRHGSFALCCLCESMFTTKLKLQHHIEAEHQLGTLQGHVYVCPICKFCMPSNQELCDHLSVLHHLTLEHPCDKCQNKVFPSELTFKIHQIEEHDYNPFKRDTNSVTDQEVIVSQKKTFQCPQCDNYLASKRVLEQHFRQVHDSANHQYKCDNYVPSHWIPCKELLIEKTPITLGPICHSKNEPRKLDSRAKLSKHHEEIANEREEMNSTRFQWSISQKSRSKAEQTSRRNCQ